MTKEPVSQTEETRIFDEDLHHKALVCNCRKTTHKGRERLCSVCERAWQQAWDLAEGKVIRKSGASPGSASEAQPVEMCASFSNKPCSLREPCSFCKGVNAEHDAARVIEAQREEEPPKPVEYRFKTSEEAALLPLPLQILRLKEINAELCRSHNTLLIENADLERKLSSPLPSDMLEPLVSDEMIAYLQNDEVNSVADMARELQQYRRKFGASLKGNG